jgi:hypothetical protein
VLPIICVVNASHQMSFSETVSDIEAELSKVTRACRDLKECRGLVLILSFAIACGNYMNAGTSHHVALFPYLVSGNQRKERADGFDIDFLPKLAETKSIDNKVTVLDFCVQSVHVVDGEAVGGIPEELQSVSSAATVDLKTMVSRIGKLASDVNGLSSYFSS